MSSDVTEKYSPRTPSPRPLSPRLRADNGSRENARDWAEFKAVCLYYTRYRIAFGAIALLHARAHQTFWHISLTSTARLWRNNSKWNVFWKTWTQRRIFLLPIWNEMQFLKNQENSLKNGQIEQGLCACVDSPAQTNNSLVCLCNFKQTPAWTQQIRLAPLQSSLR